MCCNRKGFSIGITLYKEERRIGFVLGEVVNALGAPVYTVLEIYIQKLRKLIFTILIRL